MHLQDLTATPHPQGNCIVLRWYHGDPKQKLWVRIIRREDAYPTTDRDGTQGQDLVGDIEIDLEQADWVVVYDRGPDEPPDKRDSDNSSKPKKQGLRGETLYYYTLFPYPKDQAKAQFAPKNFAPKNFAPKNCVAAMATEPYGMGAQLYDLLPGLYHRYDQQGQLHRFLQLPGNQLDQLYSFATALLKLHNRETIDGRLLPLLAEWIGWQTNYRVDIPQQRNDIRDAPFLYQKMGVTQTLEAMVTRILGWECRTKVFAHNMFTSNSPERLNLWWRRQDPSNHWSKTPELLSLDFAYGGRAAGVQDSQGRLWLFYHTRKQERWEIWYKIYTLKQDGSGQVWLPSRPLCGDRRSTIEKHPTATVQGDKLWVFWSSYDEAEQRWSIHYRTCTQGADNTETWSKVDRMEDGSGATRPWPKDDHTSRHHPVAVTDAEGTLWLFWLQRFEGKQCIYYNRYDNGTWKGEPKRVPGAQDQRSQVLEELFVLAHPTAKQLWLFWTQQVSTNNSKVQHQTRWQLVYQGVTFISLFGLHFELWGSVHPLAWSQDREAANGGNQVYYHHREPCAQVKSDG
jgi:phage tail-like protein